MTGINFQPVIWGIAGLLQDDYRNLKYGLVIVRLLEAHALRNDESYDILSLAQCVGGIRHEYS